MDLHGNFDYGPENTERNLSLDHYYVFAKIQRWARIEAKLVIKPKSRILTSKVITKKKKKIKKSYYNLIKF